MLPAIIKGLILLGIEAVGCLIVLLILWGTFVWVGTKVINAISRRWGGTE